MNHPPIETADLTSTITSEAEHTLIWSFRHWVCGHVHGHARHWDLVWRHLRDVLGAEDGTRAVTALEGMVRAICRHAGRPIHYHQPHCPCFGHDERRFIELIAACQQRQWLNAASWARGLVGDDGEGDLIGPASRFAAVLVDHGLLLRGNSAACRDISAAMPMLAAALRRFH